MSRVLAHCPNCRKPIARVVRNDAGVRAETGERYSVEVPVVDLTVRAGRVREVGVWCPLFGLDASSGAIPVRCTTCDHSSTLDAALLLERKKSPDTPPSLTDR